MGHPGSFEIISGFASTFDCVDASIFLHALQARDAKLHFNGSQLFFCYIIPFPIPNADRLTIFYNKVVAGDIVKVTPGWNLFLSSCFWFVRFGGLGEFGQSVLN